MSQSRKTILFMTRVAIFGAISAVLYILASFFPLSLPIFPSFLQLHFDEVPLFIASFAYGPWVGICALLVKTAIKLPFTTTLCVGELGDLIYSAAFILPAAFIYKKHRHFLSAVIGLAVGFVFQLIISCIANVFFIYPFYAQLLGITMDDIIAMCHGINANVVDGGWSLVWFVIVPFNAIKNALVIAITIPVYKCLHYLIDKATAPIEKGFKHSKKEDKDKELEQEKTLD